MASTVLSLFRALLSLTMSRDSRSLLQPIWAPAPSSISSWSPLGMGEERSCSRKKRRRERMISPLVMQGLYLFFLIRMALSIKARSGLRAHGWEGDLLALIGLQKLSNGPLSLIATSDSIYTCSLRGSSMMRRRIRLKVT